MSDRYAPAGKVWLCMMCGKTAKDCCGNDKVADRYQRERTSSVAAASSMNQNEKHGTGVDVGRGGEQG